MSRHRYFEKRDQPSSAHRNPVPGRHVRAHWVQSQSHGQGQSRGHGHGQGQGQGQGRSQRRRHPKLAVLVAAGAFTVVTAATVTAVTWPSSGAAAAGPGAASLNAARAVRAGSAALDTASLTSFDQARAALEAQQFRYQAMLRAERAATAAARLAARQKAAREAAAAAAKQAAEQAAAAAQAANAQATAAAAQQQAQPQQTQQAVSTPVSGSPEQIAAAMLSQFGWSSGQMSCLQPLWQRESGWNVSAYNAGSGAYGIPQALPGAKMASAGPDWQTDAATQIRWGLGYIQQIYGSPCAAWSHEEADGWY